MAKEVQNRPISPESELQQKKAEIDKKEAELSSISSNVAELSEKVHSDRTSIKVINTYLMPEETDQERIDREEQEAARNFICNFKSSREASDVNVEDFLKFFIDSGVTNQAEQSTASVITKQISEPDEVEKEVTIELELKEAISKSAELDAKISASRAELETLTQTKKMVVFDKTNLINSMSYEMQLLLLTKAQEDSNAAIIELLHSTVFGEHVDQEQQAAGEADDIADVFA